MLAAVILLSFTSLCRAQDTSVAVSIAPAATTVPSTETDAGTTLFEEETIQCKSFWVVLFTHTNGDKL